MQNNPSDSQTPAPFSCQYTPNVPELLNQLQCTLVISTYQAGKVIFISAKNDEHLIQLPRTFNKPMGIALQGDKMAIASKDEVILLTDSPGLAKYYPNNPNTYDALYMPRATYYTGQIDIHDLEWTQNGLMGVNTSFSCLIQVDTDYSFKPVWKPPFIDELVSEDRCHLNGMAIIDGRPKYVTAFGTGNSFQNWREEITKNGILMDTENNEIILDKLPMPHSPRWINNNLYLLLSATGELIKTDLEKGKYETVSKLNGFVRGLAVIGDYAFIGLSRLRKNSSTFAKLDIADKAINAGIAIVHLPTGAFTGEIKYLNSVDEIYDVQVIPGKSRPGIMNTIKPGHKLGLSIPGSTYWAKVNN